jgi:Iron-containing redox enzyme
VSPGFSAPARRGEGARLRVKIALAMPALRAAGRTFLDHPDPAAVYREYLIAAHAVVRASVPLMEAALGRAESMAADDPVSARLVDYLPEHILEETDHDAWILEDLERIGVDRDGVLARPPSHGIAALVGAQYYWIHHFHPVALLGYMAVLEGRPPSPAVVDRLVERTGYDPHAFRAIREHAVVDQAHGDEVFALVDELALSEPLSVVVGLSAMHTVASMAGVIDEIVERAG